ncbi:MAG TPA: exodeoxyribonuclease VII small subunit [Bacilli bacterium]
MFEELLKELDEIVKELESGTLSLEEAIKKYQRGLELSAQCKEKLLSAKEVIVQKMSEIDGKIS